MSVTLLLFFIKGIIGVVIRFPFEIIAAVIVALDANQLSILELLLLIAVVAKGLVTVVAAVALNDVTQIGLAVIYVLTDFNLGSVVTQYAYIQAQGLQLF